MTNNMDVILSMLTFVPMGIALFVETPFYKMFAGKYQDWEHKRRMKQLERMEETGAVSGVAAGAMVAHQSQRRATQLQKRYSQQHLL